MKAKLIKNKDGFSLYISGDGSNKWIASTDGMMMDNRLSLKNCQAIERGYDLDELSEQVYPTPIFGLSIERKRERASFRQGFQKALEILGDKKFTEEDIKRIVNYALYSAESHDRFRTKNKSTYIQNDVNDYIQSLQQNEWEVEVEMEEKYGWDLHSNPPEKEFSHLEPKLDADGCLILKRV